MAKKNKDEKGRKEERKKKKKNTCESSRLVGVHQTDNNRGQLRVTLRTNTIHNTNNGHFSSFRGVDIVDLQILVDTVIGMLRGGVVVELEEVVGLFERRGLRTIAITIRDG